MANPNSLPLYEKYWYKHNYKRVMDSLILFLLLLLLGYRVISVNNYSFPWFVALASEIWFTLSWVFTITTQWNPALIKTYPDRLLQRVQELPAVDLFVTTADVVLEPTIITVNTVLSLLALDYPAHKLACYVSDDGCSPLTFYALHEASEFAKLWVPFCKKYHVQVRAPFRYFCDECTTNKKDSTSEFRQEWLRMKDIYENLSRKIEDSARKSIPSQLDREFAVFSNTEGTNHPTIIKDLGICIPAAIFVIFEVYTLFDYLALGLSIREWWNSERMSAITPMNAGFCGFISVLLKLIGISDTVFDITKKDLPPDEDGHDKDAGRFTFDESLVFLPGTAILLMQLTAMFIKLLGMQPTVPSQSGNECGLAEMLCSVYLMVCYWPFFRGLFETGKYGIPLSTICKAAALTCLFVHLCRRTITG